MSVHKLLSLPIFPRKPGIKSNSSDVGTASSVFISRTPKLAELFAQTKILVVGAGGLGAQVLKCLVVCGFRQIHVVDMDTLELSNLNRQLLFRESDVGQPKAVVAAERLSLRYRDNGLKVVPHVQRVQDFDIAFFKKFDAVIAGLDNVEARRWLNATLCDAVEFTPRYVDGVVKSLVADQTSIIPLLDGGTEGFMGHCRAIIPGYTSCFECSIDLFKPADTYPICTIVDRPRLPEHCVEHALVVAWAKERPQDIPDFDNPDHVDWLFEKASIRAETFGIMDVTRQLTLGRIVPAIASTNQIVGGMLVNETIKILTGVYPLNSGFLMYNGIRACHVSSLSLDRNPACAVCATDMHPGKIIVLPKKGKLREALATLAIKDFSLKCLNGQYIDSADLDRPVEALLAENIISGRKGEVIILNSPSLDHTIKLRMFVSDIEEP